MQHSKIVSDITEACGQRQRSPCQDVIFDAAAAQGGTARDEDAMAGPWWRLRCHIVDAEGETIDHREQGWRDCGEQRGPRHAAALGIYVDMH